MRVDYSNLDYLQNYDIYHSHQPMIDAIEIAKTLTERQTIIALKTNHNQLLCQEIALTTSRIAAILITYDLAPPFFYKKARELCNAEGAFFILQIHLKSSVKINTNYQPDIYCADQFIACKKDLTS